MSLTAALYLLAWCGCLALAFLRSPVFGLYAYVADFYFHPSSRWWGQDLPDLRWSLLAAVVTLIATLLAAPKVESRGGWLSLTPVKLLLGFAAWVWLQNLWALDANEHFEFSILMTKYLVVVYLIYRLVSDQATSRWFLGIHVLGCAYLGWLILETPGGQGRFDGLGGPGLGEANALAMQLACGALAAAALFATGRWWSRALLCVAGVLILNGLVQTESRGAFLALLAGGLVFLWFSPNQWRWRWIALASVALILLLPRVPETFWQRMSTITAAVETPEQVDLSAATRLELVSAQWQMFLRYPLGSGHRGTAALSPRFLSSEYLAKNRSGEDTGARSSHNTYLTVLVEQGIPGVLLFAGLILWLARTSLVARRQLAVKEATGDMLELASVAAILGVVLVAGMFRDFIKAEIFIWGLALLAGIHCRSSGQPRVTAHESELVGSPKVALD